MDETLSGPDGWNCEKLKNLYQHKPNDNYDIPGVRDGRIPKRNNNKIKKEYQKNATIPKCYRPRRRRRGKGAPYFLAGCPDGDLGESMIPESGRGPPNLLCGAKRKALGGCRWVPWVNYG